MIVDDILQLLPEPVHGLKVIPAEVHLISGLGPEAENLEEQGPGPPGHVITEQWPVMRVIHQSVKTDAACN